MKTFPFTVYDSRISIYQILLDGKLDDLQLRSAGTAAESQDVHDDRVALPELADGFTEGLCVRDRYAVDPLDDVALAQSIVAIRSLYVRDKALRADLLHDQTLLPLQFVAGGKCRRKLRQGEAERLCFV